MYQSNVQKDIVPKEQDSYVDFGLPYKDFPNTSDPCDVCLPGSFLNPDKSSDIQSNNCPMLMSQKCSQEWTDKCSLYADSRDDIVSLRKFIRDTASKKFCKLNSDSSCKVLCQPFNPIAQDSPLVCDTVGRDVLTNLNDEIDIGWYLPANMSPDYMSDSCSQTCKVSTNVEDGDVIVDACLKYGFCNDILTGVCREGGEINHSGLKRFCDLQVNKKEEKEEKEEKADEKDEKTNVPIKFSQQNSNESISRFYTIVAMAIALLLIWIIFIRRK
jgi:hypothetical protein